MAALEPCPFDGATPHKGAGKNQHCQLHGEVFQAYSIWCPHGCAKITEPSEESARLRWNTRAASPSTPDLLAAAILAAEYDDLLQSHAGPIHMLTAGECVEINAAYRRWITASRAVIAKENLS